MRQKIARDRFYYWEEDKIHSLVIPEKLDYIGLAGYLLTRKRPPEQETIDRFLDILKPTIEEAAYDLGYNVSWGDVRRLATEDMGIQNLWYIRNPDITSNTHLSLSLRHRESGDLYPLEIRIDNRAKSHELNFFSEKRQYRSLVLPGIDYSLRKKSFIGETIKRVYRAMELMFDEQFHHYILEHATKRPSPPSDPSEKKIHFWPIP